MKRLITVLGLIIIFIIFFSLLINPIEFNNNIINTLYIWLFKVYPSLFTFYIICSILLNLGIIGRITVFLKKRNFMLFKNEKMLSLFLLSIISGNPASTSMIIDEYDKGKLNKREVECLLLYCSFLSPLFIIAFIEDLKLSLLIIFCHVVSNLIITFFSNCGKEVNNKEEVNIYVNYKAIFESLIKAVEILMMVAAIMCFCNIIIYSMNCVFSFFKINNNFIRILLSFVEVSTGTNNIINMPISEKIKMCLLVFLFGFGGISIHLQVYMIIKGKIKYLTFLIGRLLQGVISTIIFICIYFFFW